MKCANSAECEILKSDASACPLQQEGRPYVACPEREAYEVYAVQCAHSECGSVESNEPIDQPAFSEYQAQPVVEDFPPQPVLAECLEPRLCEKATSQSAAAQAPLHLEKKCAEQSEAQLLCYVSGRGGVGKTTIVAATAAVAASWGMKVACLDLDLSFGNLFSGFGLDGPADLGILHEIAENKSRLSAEDVLARAKRTATGIDVYGPCELPEHAELVVLYAGEIIRILSTAYDLVLIDTSPAWSDACALAAQVSDRVMVVSDQVNGGEASLAKASGLLVRLGVTRTRIVRMVNRVDRKREVEDGLMRAQKGLEVARIYRLVNEPEVRELFGSGHIERVADQSDPLGRSIAAYLATTLSELGCLPACDAAHDALQYREERKSAFWFLGR